MRRCWYRQTTLHININIITQPPTYQPYTYAVFSMFDPFGEEELFPANFSAVHTLPQRLCLRDYVFSVKLVSTEALYSAMTYDLTQDFAPRRRDEQRMEILFI